MRGRILTMVSAIILGGLFLLPAMTLADEYGISATKDAVNSDKDKGQLLPDTVAGGKTVPEVIGKVVGVGLSLVGLVFFGLTLYAGFRWMIAMGNTEDVEKAKETLIAAVIGLIIVLAAYAITSFVFSNLGSTTQSEPAPQPLGPPLPSCANDLKGACATLSDDPGIDTCSPPTPNENKIPTSDCQAGQVCCVP